MILSSFAAKNFKSISARGAGIEIAPITVLVGENGAGKSTLLEALALTAQRARPSAKGKSVLDGEFVRYESSAEVFHKGSTESPIELAVSLALSKDEREFYRPMANWTPDMAEIESMFAGHLRPEAEKAQGLTANDVGRLMVGVGLAAGDMTADGKLWARARLSTSRLDSATTIFTQRMALWEYSANASSSTAVELCGASPRLYLGGTEVGQPFFARLFSGADRRLSFGGRTSSPQPTLFGGMYDFPAGELHKMLHDFFYRTEDAVLNCLQKVYYIPAPRGHVPSTVHAGDSPDWIGTSADQLARFIIKKQSDRDKTVFRKIQEWAGRFGVHDLNAGSDGSAAFHVDYEDDVLKTGLGARGLGYGSTQVLPIIAQGFAAPEGSCILIEEPEVSLHPNAQITLLDMFAELVRQGKCLLITTHSATLLMGLGRLFEGPDPLEPEQLAVYEATKRESGTDFHRLEVDKTGYIKNWIESFGQAEKHILESWIKSVPEVPESD